MIEKMLADAYHEYKITNELLAEDKRIVEANRKRLHEEQLAAELIRSVSETILHRAHQKVADLVSRSLSAVFDEPYKFCIILERKRNQTEARIALVRDGKEVAPMEAAGGGVVDVAAFSLRLAVILLQQPAARRLIVLDEPFKFVARELQPRLAQLLEELSSELGVQFVIVTHYETFEIGVVRRIDG